MILTKNREGTKGGEGESQLREPILKGEKGEVRKKSTRIVLFNSDDGLRRSVIILINIIENGQWWRRTYVYVPRNDRSKRISHVASVVSIFSARTRNVPSSIGRAREHYRFSIIGVPAGHHFNN